MAFNPLAPIIGGGASRAGVKTQPAAVLDRSLLVKSKSEVRPPYNSFPSVAPPPPPGLSLFAPRGLLWGALSRAFSPLAAVRRGYRLCLVPSSLPFDPRARSRPCLPRVPCPPPSGPQPSVSAFAYIFSELVQYSQASWGPYWWPRLLRGDALLVLLGRSRCAVRPRPRPLTPPARAVPGADRHRARAEAGRGGVRRRGEGAPEWFLSFRPGGHARSVLPLVACGLCARGQVETTSPL